MEVQLGLRHEFEKAVVIADVIRFVINRIGQDEQDAIVREVVHFPPDIRADEEALVGAVELNLGASGAIVEDHAAGAGERDADLGERLVGVEAAGHPVPGAVNVIGPPDGKRNFLATLESDERTAMVTADGEGLEGGHVFFGKR